MKMITENFKLIAVALVVLVIASLPAPAQDNQKNLTNADVVKMAKAGLPESVVVSAIQSHPGKYDISPDALIALQKDGVTAGEMDALIAESKKSSGGAAGANAIVSEKSHMPRVTVIAGKTSEPLALEKTELAQTKTKPSSMSSLAGDSALNDAMRAGINTAAWDTATHVNSGVGGSAVYQGGSVLTSMMARRKATMTYVWGVPGVVSKTVLQTTAPSFTVDFANVMGANPDDFEPMIVKLTP
ncbi:MAG: hypothetical protein ACRD3B_03845, partial [Candidatus Sulfotelmatobacter sp.]